MDKTIGIIGGGQLGKMLLQYCSTLSIKTKIYDKSQDSICKNMCSTFHLGDFMDYDKIMEFGRECDIVTYELEHISVRALFDLEKEGITVYPRPHILETIQNKYTQKQFLEKNNIPTCEFSKFNSIEEIRKSIDNNSIKLPCIWKKTTGGYDGFGVSKITEKDDLNKLTDGECIIEEYVNIQKELSIVLARNPKGDIKTYRPIEMVFNYNSNQLVCAKSPAIISNDMEQNAIEIAKKIVNLFEYVGVMAVEMFQTNNGILVNEIAPRPHNSGHLTIECSAASQFEQHIRGILGLPLSKTGMDKLLSGSCLMYNIIGEEGYSGIADYNSTEIIDLFSSCYENLHIHIYGKKETKPNRKLGHITMSNSITCENTIKKIIKACKIKSIQNNQN